MHIGRHLTVTALLLGLTGCADMSGSLGDLTPGFLTGDAGDTAEVAENTANFAQDPGEGQSQIITGLLHRRSLLQAGTAYATVADTALSASARAAESELLAAKLRAEAASKNWLPTIEPGFSLTSLSDIAAQILVEQVLFDNGRRKAERAFAAHDVEVAAVNLSIDMNARVETALRLYLTALKGEEKATLYHAAIGQMAGFERIVRGRVDGGVSDRSDLRVAQSKINDLKSALKASEESRAAARAELQAMTGQTFDTRPEQLALQSPPAGVQHLDVVHAEAVAARSIAEAKADKAGLLPSVNAEGTFSDGGGSIGGLTLDVEQALGLGTGASMKAIDAAAEAAGRQVAQAEEDARRSISRLQQQLASYRRQEAEAARLAADSRTTFELFQAQFRAGQRSVMEVVSLYEEFVERKQDHLDAKYEVVLTQLEMARDMGLLADGEKI